MKILKISYLDRSCKEQELSIPEEVTTLRINLSTGRWVEVEIFERIDGKITIRGEDTLAIQPDASNSISVSVKGPVL